MAAKSGGKRQRGRAKAAGTTAAAATGQLKQPVFAQPEPTADPKVWGGPPRRVRYAVAADP